VLQPAGGFDLSLGSKRKHIDRLDKLKAAMPVDTSAEELRHAQPWQTNGAHAWESSKGKLPSKAQRSSSSSPSSPGATHLLALLDHLPLHLSRTVKTWVGLVFPAASIALQVMVKM
jgi:hypothetical protein